ncbi:MAG TPA: lysyl oxidase family protein [Planctomycetota bacterium]|jgi:hypothetical protein|nr:lysyl oxidase family protein [Planctomycetota bacterium]
MTRSPIALVLRRALPALALVVVAACGGGGGGGSDPTGADLGIDADRLEDSVLYTEETFPPEHCAVVEGAVEAPGTRRLLRFDTVIVNHGDVHVRFGDPVDPLPPLEAVDFEWSPCHGHFHLSNWSDYHLEDDLGVIVAQGHKQAFCLRDNVQYVPGTFPQGFDCDDQGLSAGWADIYDRTLDGQWVDITDVVPGDYWLVVTTDNADYVEEPVDASPNEVRVRVTLPPLDAVLPDGP